MNGNMDVMAMIATSLLACTIFIVLWGAILGMIRGRNRSILRLNFESIAIFDQTSKKLIVDAIVDAIAQQNLQEEVANDIKNVLGLA